MFRTLSNALALIALGLPSYEAMPQEPEPPGEVVEAFDRIAVEADGDAMSRAFERLWGHKADVPVAIHTADAGSWWREPDTGRIVPFALRDDQPAANTCLDAQTAPRVLLVAPLPHDPTALAALLWHERWHCVQHALGLAGREGDTSHLDSEQGRLWLRLELRALAAALASHDDATAMQAAADALSFRLRRARGDGFGSGPLGEEAKVERNEGLAEYSGRAVAATAGDPVPALVASLRAAESSPSFVRSAAYATGPAYGLLLDRWAGEWRRRVLPDMDLPALLARAIAVDVTSTDTAARAGIAYGMDAVRTEEAARAQARKLRATQYRDRLLGSGALHLPLRNPSVSFDPRTLFPLDDDGIVYTPITVRDAWGELQARDGALMATDWSRVSVDALRVEGCARSWRGNGWTLTLSAGWRLARDDAGRWRLAEGGTDGCAAR